MRTKDMLQKCRELAQEIQLREEGLKELRAQTISSPKLDGMPRGNVGHNANDNRLIQIEKRERDIERDKRKLERLRNDARRAIRPLKPEQRIFYAEYFIEAQKARAARTMAGISKRTATRYLGEIRAELNINKKTGN